MDTETIAKISMAVANAKSIIIKLNGDTGKVTVSIGHTVVARYKDAHAAVEALIDPNLIKELQ